MPTLRLSEAALWRFERTEFPDRLQVSPLNKKERSLGFNYELFVFQQEVRTNLRKYFPLDRRITVHESIHYRLHHLICFLRRYRPTVDNSSIDCLFHICLLQLEETRHRNQS